LKKIGDSTPEEGTKAVSKKSENRDYIGLNNEGRVVLFAGGICCNFELTQGIAAAADVEEQMKVHKSVLRT
jgi:hypothetical protein